MLTQDMKLVMNLVIWIIIFLLIFKFLWLFVHKLCRRTEREVDGWLYITVTSTIRIMEASQNQIYENASSVIAKYF